MFYR
jgi:hypothetical protein